MNKKILFCASDASHIELFHLPYINYFKSLGYEIHIVSNKPVAAGIAAKSFVLGFGKSIAIPSLKNIFTVYKLSKIMSKFDYDIVSSHSALAGMLVRVAVGFSEHRPVMVHTSHGYPFKDEGGLKNSFYLWVERCLSKKTNLLVTMNSEDKQIAEKYRLCENLRFIHGCGLNPQKLQPIGDALSAELRAEYHISEKTKTILYAAEFSSRKNHKLLINSFAQAMQAVAEGCDIKLLLAGEGRLKKSCIKLAKRLKVSDHVIFCGYVKDINRLYSIADIVASPSLCEGVPFNIMEALHKNIPVIASKIKGHTDLIGEDENGLLFASNNAEELKKCIIRLVSDKRLYDEMKSKSRLKEEYYLKNAFKEMTAIYNEAKILSQK